MKSDVLLLGDECDAVTVEAPPPDVPRVLAVLNDAYRAAAEGDFGRAIPHFCAARSELVPYVNSQRLAAAVSSESRKLGDESRAFEALAADRENLTGPRTVLLSDSLGLPRAGPGEADCFEKTYAGLILHARRGPVQPIFRRLGTTWDVVDGLVNRASLAGADVMIHIGLNDCAVRMFKEKERIALTLVSEYLRERFLRFVKAYRSKIVLSDLDYTYTPLHVFRDRLSRSVQIARRSRARSISIATIVQPPETFAVRTPRMAWNFNRYNSVVREVAEQNGITLIDINGLCHHHGKEKTLSADGMHLSAAGHTLMADAYLDSIEQ
ncbi:GDSL-type esterase/lipase family protein [Sinorhizobium meliloti]|uniref:SGNH/GDSL hydrolase family protein n=1 Tax=Rhizobium meliloti TaxID=382 RepID=UPI00299DDE19